jgi:hypothetical protein
VTYALFVLVAVIGLLVLIPTRRLYLAGWSRRALVAYYVAMVALGVVVAELRVPARFLIPILVVAYIAPFVTARVGFARLFGRDTAGRDAVIVRTVEPTLLPTGSEPGPPDEATSPGEAPAPGEATEPGPPGEATSPDEATERVDTL